MATVETPRTEVRAQARFVRTAPRKAALVVDQIRGRSVPEARTILAFMTRDAAVDVRKVLDSAVSNAEVNHGLVGDDLYVASAFVGAGPTLKRWRARARGRVARIRKRTCHITIALALPSGEEIPEPVQQAAPAVEAPPVEDAPAEEAAEAVEEEKPKPRRAARKKPEPEPEAEVAATAAEEAPPAEPKPKPKPRQKPAAEKESGEETEPARRPKKKEGES
jgi:large subunit ribosomal protein L22